MTNPTYDLVEYRFQSDTGSVDGASLLGTLNNGISLGTTTSNKRRIRIQILNDNAKVSNVTLQWQYNNTTQSTGWVNITAASNHIRAVATSDAGGPYDGASCGNILTTRGTFDPDGQVTEDGLNGSYNHAASAYAEEVLIFYIVDASVNHNDVIQMRPLSTEGYTITYTNTPQVTVIKGTASSDNQPAYIRGSVNTSDNRIAYVAGSLDTSSSQIAYLEGALSSSDNQPSYTHGQDTASDNQPAYIEGAGGTLVRSNVPAYIYSEADASDSQAAYMLGNIPLEDMYDDFDDNSRDTTKWDLGSFDSAGDNASVTTSETNNRLEIQPLDSTAGSNYYGFKSVDFFDLTDSSVFVEVSQLDTQASSNTVLMLQNGTANNQYQISVYNQGTSLRFEYKDASTPNNTSITYNSTDHRWWRIRHDYPNDNVLWETSPDGMNWTTRRTVALSTIQTAGIDETQLKVYLSAGTSGSVSSPVATYFDNYNHHPLIRRREEINGGPVQLIPNSDTPDDWNYILWGADAPSHVIKFNGKLYMYYIGADNYDSPLDTPTNRALGVATSWDGFTWENYGSNPIITYPASPTSVEEGVGGARAVVVGGTIHLYYAAIRDTGGGNVDLDIRYRSSTDGVTFSNDTLILQTGGSEYQPVGIIHDGTNYHLYVKENLAGSGAPASGPIRRYSGTSPTSLSLQGTVLGSTAQDYRGNGKGYLANYVDSDTFLFLTAQRQPPTGAYWTPNTGWIEMRTMDDTAPSTISAPLFRFRLDEYGSPITRYRNTTPYYDADEDLWYFFTLDITSDGYPGDIVLFYSGNPIAKSGVAAYIAGSASIASSQAAYMAGVAAASDSQQAYVEGLYQPLPVTEPWTGTNDDPWRISHWVTDIIDG